MGVIHRESQLNVLIPIEVPDFIILNVFCSKALFAELFDLKYH